MKAIAISGIEQVTVSLTDSPKPQSDGPADVLIRVLCVGLDGTDREIIADNFARYPEGRSDMVIGHELLGVVERAGPESGFARGDFVTALVRRPCGECVNCRNGQQDFCQTGRYTERGIKGADGYLCEYVAEHSAFVIEVPEACLPYGVLVEPQSIVEKVWAQTLKIQQRMIWQPGTVLILGSGPLGILAAMTCRILGFDTHVWSKSDAASANADILRRIGAHYREADSSAEDAFKSGLTAYAERLGTGFDMIWECTGHAPLGFEAIPLVRNNGILALLGVTPGSGRLDLPSDTTYRELVVKNKCVIGSVNASRDDFETAIHRLREIERHYPGMLDKLQTDRMSIEDVPAIEFGRIAIKAVVDVVPQAEWASLSTRYKEDRGR
ncbi:glucose 1-dehydrogenase [Paenibacillus glycinis]|uniref:Alcohol dehydrogenase catalytic domain-containing protein n=1 Tax=Paenibacillus glycinis TaxID=2697035 RepID=A0ABW9XQS9_9BACL|nr:glucose 1-dehydrogenase [Paenibacillus glycinis]NBD24858.1 alcohol dehydrogenase catalytic domain-containing protein [Paenibacillus glycinis]